MKIIAYGSLMNQESLEKTLGRPAKLFVTNLVGYCRVFNAVFGEYAFLNLGHKQNCKIEVAYFEIDEKELIKFEKRETGSEILEVAAGFYAFVWPERYCRGLPVLKSYYSFCLAGANELGIDFDLGLAKPEAMIDDSTSPKYIG